MADKKELKNYFVVVGRLKAVNFRNEEKKAEQVSARATIESEIEGKTLTFEIDFFSKAVTNAGAPNKLYAAYCDLPNHIGQKIKVTGDFRENRYYDVTKEVIVGSNLLNGRFINYDTQDTDSASFEFQGFIVQGLVEKINKNNEVYGYTISIGQEGYKENSLTVIKFNVEATPENSGNIDYIRENYLPGYSVTVFGKLDFHTEVTTQEIGEGGFGGPIVREFKNTYRNFYITKGTTPFSPDEDKAFYNDDKIAVLVNSYKSRDVELEKEAKEKNVTPTSTPTSSVSTPAPKKRTGSLI